MSKHRVKVRWSNEKKDFEGVDLDLNDSPSVFKVQLFSLTGVPVERQRLMCSGKMIRDDVWPENFAVTESTTFMLMGSSEKLPEAPVEKPKFVEDMSENELAVALDTPAGLTNLGNTCYMSATVQCLKTIPELREALNKFDFKLSLLASLSDEPNHPGVTAALRDLYDNMDGSSVAEPVILLKMLHNAIPRFAQRGEGNVFQQQDANECWTELTRILQQNLKSLDENSKFTNAVDQFMSGTIEAEMKCNENADEPSSMSSENFLQLSCFISQDVRYMQAGLVSRMKETIEKFSPSLQRDASYTKISRIDRLPSYLTIQFVRFHYKGNVQTNAKLLRDVKFSLVLDVHDLCTSRLQEKLAPMRLKYKKADDINATCKLKPGLSAKESLDQKAGEPSTGESASQDSEKTTSAKSTTSTAGSVIGSDKSAPDAYRKYLANDPEEMKKYTFGDDPGSNNSGFYELRAVLTHKGRSSASGHYVAWIKKEEQWYKCDDDYVSPVDSDEVLKLSGGGDWHCAYVCLYGPRFLDLDETKQS